MSATSKELSWVDLVGYTYEFTHTGVLKWLLEQPQHGLRVARRLTGIADIHDVGEVATQRSAGGAARVRPDLAAVVNFNGRKRFLAVETKVDSEPRPGQLENTAEPGSAVVLLAVGLPSLQLREFAPPADDPTIWSIVNLESWVALLNDLEDLPPAIALYRSAVERELSEHRAA